MCMSWFILYIICLLSGYKTSCGGNTRKAVNTIQNCCFLWTIPMSFSFGQHVFRRWSRVPAVTSLTIGSASLRGISKFWYRPLLRGKARDILLGRWQQAQAHGTCFFIGRIDIWYAMIYRLITQYQQDWINKKRPQPWIESVEVLFYGWSGNDHKLGNGAQTPEGGMDPFFRIGDGLCVV